MSLMAPQITNNSIFVQQFVQANNKDIIVLHYSHFVGESTCNRQIPFTNGQ